MAARTGICPHNLRRLRRRDVGGVHVRTKNFPTFEANPHNPIFTPSTDPAARGSEGILTLQVFQPGARYYMLYAGTKGKEWQMAGLGALSVPRRALPRSRRVLPADPYAARYPVNQAPVIALANETRNPDCVMTLFGRGELHLDGALS